MSGTAITISAFLAFFFFLLNQSTAQPPTPNVLYTDDQLLYPDYLRYGTKFKLTMQEDCNLVLTHSGKIKWSSNTTDKGVDCYLWVKKDGNLVIMDDETRKPVWQSCTTRRGNGKYALVLQRDGDLVLYGGGPLWATDTAKKVTAVNRSLRAGRHGGAIDLPTAN